MVAEDSVHLQQKNPIPGQLPRDQTTAGGTFKGIGTDFAGPVKYKQGKKSKETRIWLSSLAVFQGLYTQS